MSKIRKIGVLTSGGDAPGMNAAIRAVARAAIVAGCEAYGVYGGYQGLIKGDICRLKSRDVSNIIQRGGTILKSARSKEFRTIEGRAKAAENLRAHGIDSLVVIGGDGSFTGAKLLAEEHGIHVVGLPGTIDNDLFGTDSTIGYDTAINTAIEAIDKIKDTASAHNRLFFVEVMGRDAGFIALRVAIATGAEGVLVPELETDLLKLDSFLDTGYNPVDSSGIIIVAEGECAGGAYTIAEKVAELHPHFDIRVSVLGHIQRGGSPSAFDRVLASQLGVAAVDAILDGQTNIMVGVMSNKIVHTPLNKTIKHSKGLNESLLGLIDVLSISHKE